MVFEDEDNIVGVTKIISEFMTDYRAIRLNTKTKKYLKEVQPPVVLFNLSTLEKSITFYSELVESNTFKRPHFSIVLCSNKESSAAFRASIKGVFDNYFVSQPLYERYRLKMLIHHGLLVTTKENEYEGLLDEHFDEIEEELAELIDEAASCKDELISSIDIGRKEIQDAADKMTESPQIDPTQVAKELTEQHVQPLLALLEKDIKAGLDKMVAEMASQQKKSAAKRSHIAEKNTQAKNQAILDYQTKQQVIDDDQLEDPVIGKGKVLIVEDNPIYQNMLVNVLENEDYQTKAAKDGLTALNLLREEKFDVIFMDLHMPKLDGLNTTKKIRGIELCKDTPVIALTSNKNKEIVKKWASYGLQGYIMKPSTKEQIITTINRALSNDSVDASA